MKMLSSRKCYLVGQLRRTCFISDKCSYSTVLSSKPWRFLKGGPQSNLEQGKQRCSAHIFEEGIFESIATTKGEENYDSPSGSKKKGNEKGLVPEGWRSVQEELHKSKQDIKRQRREQEMKFAKERLLAKRLSREGRRKLSSDGNSMETDLASNVHVIEHDINAKEVGVQELYIRPESRADSLDSNACEESTPHLDKIVPDNDPNYLSLNALEDLLMNEKQQYESDEIDIGGQDPSMKEKPKYESDEFEIGCQDIELLFSEEEKCLMRKSGPDFNILATGTQNMLKNKTVCCDYGVNDATLFASLSADPLRHDKWLPLHTLVISGQLLLMDRMLRKNVNINALDKDGHTALQKAILCKKDTAVSMLLKAKADVNVIDRQGASLIHYAVQAASGSILKMLLKHGVDVNLADEEGWTPLHLAVQSGRPNIVKLLVINGADKNLKTKLGFTPLDICFAFGRSFDVYKIAKVLKRYPKVALETKDNSAIDTEGEEGDGR